MQIKPDCIRDILLEIEGNIEKTNEIIAFVPGKPRQGRLTAYSFTEIAYHLRQCDYAGYIIGYTSDIGGNVIVKDLSPSGHRFLADIRSDNIWNKTKTIAGNIGSYSLDTLSRIATGVLTELIKGQVYK